MTTNPLPVTDADVNAYVDGQLAPARVPVVEGAIARDPALAARVAELRAQSAALRDALDPWLDEALPDRLVAATAGPAPRARDNLDITVPTGIPSTAAISS